MKTCEKEGKCGHENQDTARFCARCGQPFDDATERLADTDLGEYSERQPFDSSPYILTTVLAFLFLILLACSGVFN